jgi:hypothetical protein
MCKRQNNCITIPMSHTLDHMVITMFTAVHKEPPPWGSCNQSSPLHITDAKYKPPLSTVELIWEQWLRNGHEREKGTRISFPNGEVARACKQPITTIYCKDYGCVELQLVMKVSRINSIIQIQHTILISLLIVPSSRGVWGCGHVKFLQNVTLHQ